MKRQRPCRRAAGLLRSFAFLRGFLCHRGPPETPLGRPGDFQRWANSPPTPPQVGRGRREDGE
eukprot:8778991-Pyramimonas_sp.AAC.1